MCASYYFSRFLKDMVFLKFFLDKINVEPLSYWRQNLSHSATGSLTINLHMLKPDRPIHSNAQGRETIVGNCEYMCVCVCLCWDWGWYIAANWKQMSCFLIMVPRNRHHVFDKELQWPQGWAGWMLQLGSFSWSKCCFKGLIETMRSSCFSAKRGEQAELCY